MGKIIDPVKKWDELKNLDYSDLRKFMLSVEGITTGWNPIGKISNNLRVKVTVNNVNYNLIAPKHGINNAPANGWFIDGTDGNLIIMTMHDLNTGKDVVLGACGITGDNHGYAVAVKDTVVRFTNENMQNSIPIGVVTVLDASLEKSVSLPIPYNNKKINKISTQSEVEIDWSLHDGTILEEIVRAPYKKLGYNLPNGEWLSTNYVPRMGGEKNIKWNIAGNDAYVFTGILNGINDVNMIGFHMAEGGAEVWVVAQKTAGDRKVPADGEVYIKIGNYTGDGQTAKIKDMQPGKGKYADKHVLSLYDPIPLTALVPEGKEYVMGGNKKTINGVELVSRRVVIGGQDDGLDCYQAQPRALGGIFYADGIATAHQNLFRPAYWECGTEDNVRQLGVNNFQGGPNYAVTGLNELAKRTQNGLKVEIIVAMCGIGNDDPGNYPNEVRWFLQNPYWVNGGADYQFTKANNEQQRAERIYIDYNTEGKVTRVYDQNNKDYVRTTAANKAPGDWIIGFDYHWRASADWDNNAALPRGIGWRFTDDGKIEALVGWNNPGGNQGLWAGIYNCFVESK